MHKNTAIILAAGTGSRMKLKYNKVLHEINKPLLYYTILAFEKNTLINTVVIVTSANDLPAIQKIVQDGDFSKVHDVILGGDTRQASSYNGTKHAKDAHIVAVHDGARPFVSDTVITKCIESAQKYGGSIAAVPSKDTMKFSTEDGFVEKTLDRDKLWSVQTPQTFQREILLEAHEKALADNFEGTDEASLVERINKPIYIVESTYDNIKITTPEDLILAEKIIESRK